MKRVKVEKWESRAIGVMLSSGGGHSGGPRLILEGFGYYVTVRIPQLIKPERHKVIAGWDAATVERIGRNWYWNIIERRFGFYVDNGFLNVSFGRSTMDSSTEQRWGYFFPWRSWRLVRHSLYDLAGNWLLDLPEVRLTEPYEANHARWNMIDALKKAQPTAHFKFLDYDAEPIRVRCRVEEREAHRGSGWWKWLSWFTRPNIDRTVQLDFSSEVGSKKGSWKGGVVGSSESIEPGESVESAFRRYCSRKELVFIGPCDAFERRNEAGEVW